jgi:hypothetical protein
MPVHDWTRVAAGIFHDFHQAWIVEIRNRLNAGLLPKGYYAMAEQIAGGPQPDVLTLEAEDIDDGPSDAGGTAVATQTGLLLTESPPQVRHVLDDDTFLYALKADRLAIRHVSGDRVVAFLEIVSAGNKQSAAMLKQFRDKLSDAFNAGCHLLIIDLHPPGKHDPEGIHAAFWTADTPTVTPAEPLSVSAYRAGSRPGAYFEPLAVGAKLPDFPLFLTSKRYVNVPLELTYQAAWQGVPDRWKRVIEG